MARPASIEESPLTLGQTPFFAIVKWEEPADDEMYTKLKVALKELNPVAYGLPLITWKLIDAYYADGQRRLLLVGNGTEEEREKVIKYFSQTGDKQSGITIKMYHNVIAAADLRKRIPPYQLPKLHKSSKPDVD